MIWGRILGFQDTPQVIPTHHGGALDAVGHLGQGGGRLQLGGAGGHRGARGGHEGARGGQACIGGENAQKKLGKGLKNLKNPPLEFPTHLSVSGGVLKQIYGWSPTLLWVSPLPKRGPNLPQGTPPHQMGVPPGGPKLPQGSQRGPKLPRGCPLPTLWVSPLPVGAPQRGPKPPQGPQTPPNHPPSPNGRPLPTPITMGALMGVPNPPQCPPQCPPVPHRPRQGAAGWLGWPPRALSPGPPGRWCPPRGR